MSDLSESIWVLDSDTSAYAAVCWPVLVIHSGTFDLRGRKDDVVSKGNKPLTREAAAWRLAIAPDEMPNLGRAWTERDVKAERQRQRQARLDVVLARRQDFKCPPVPEAAAEFGRAFATVNLLEHLHDALDCPAADIEVWDCGYDVSTHARRADETNRERVKRGVGLSGRDDGVWVECGGYREPGTLGDLFDAPTGNTVATYVSGAGLAAETFGDAWYDRWALQRLPYAYVIARLVLAGDVETLETIAGVPRQDVEPEHPRRHFDGVTADLMSLARQALDEWMEDPDIDVQVLDPEELVDMDAPVAALPRILLQARRGWSRVELLAAVIAGLNIPRGGGDLADG